MNPRLNQKLFFVTGPARGASSTSARFLACGLTWMKSVVFAPGNDSASPRAMRSR